MYTTIGGVTQWDQLYKIKNTKESHQIDLNKELPLSRNAHLSIIGDYIIQTQLSEEDSKKIDELYTQCKSEQELDIAINKLAQGTHILKIKLLKNKSKALLLRKKLSKNMYIPKKTLNMFKLC